MTQNKLIDIEELKSIAVYIQALERALYLNPSNSTPLEITQPEANKTAVFTQSGNNLPQPEAVAGGDEPKYHYNYSTALMNIEFEAFEDGFIVLKSEEGWHFKVAIPTTEKYSPLPQPEAANVALDAD